MDLTKQITDNLKWRSVIENFVQILRMNICVVDQQGRPLLIPNHNSFGWELLADPLDAISRSNLSREWQEWQDELKLHHFVFPVGRHVVPEAYVILGPIILNKRLEKSQYIQLAVECGRNIEHLEDVIENIRVVSYTSLKHITDFIQSAFELSDEVLIQEAISTETIARGGLNSVLQSMLDLSLGIARAQSGSVMIFDIKTKELSVRVAKGLAGRYLKTPVKIDEGIAGLAFREKKALILTDKSKDNRIGHLLNRKEIKRSIVMPFDEPTKKISGVLSLNITTDAQGAKKNGLRRITERLSQITSFIKDV